MATEGALERAEDAYLRILEAVAARADEMGRRPVASHWPHVGSRYRPGGLLFCGQALDGWDAPDCPARWWPRSDIATPEARADVLRRTQSWHADLPEPLWGVLEQGKRSGSPFWSLAAGIADAVSPGEGPWYARIAWGNVYPLGYDDLDEPRIPSGPPVGALREVQDPLVGPLLGALVELLDPGVVVVVSGPDFWRHAERDLGLGLAPAPFPLIREGRAGGRAWLVGYHPGYARKAGARFHGPATGTGAYYVEQVRAAVERLGAAR